MQFKVQGRRVQVLAYRGYDREKRRSKVKLLGSYNVFTGEMTDKLKNNLTEEETKEVLLYIEKTRQKADDLSRLYTAETIASQIKSAAKTIADGELRPDLAWTVETWAAIDELGRALRRAGCPRPPKPKKSKTGPDGGGVGVLPGQLELPSA